MHHQFQSTDGGVFSWDLSDAAQCAAALCKMCPAQHAQREAALQAVQSWNIAVHTEKMWIKAKQRHDEWAVHKAAHDAWVAADDPELPKVPKPSPEPQQPGPRPPAPGDQPPAVPDVTAADVLGNLAAGWEDVTGNWPPAPPIADVRKAAKASIEAAFSAALSPYVPRLEGYKLREAQAAIYKAAGYAGDVPSQVAAYQVASGMTPQVATDTILAQAAAFRSALEALETRRMRKFEVDAMQDAGAVEAKAAQICAEINAIADML